MSQKPGEHTRTNKRIKQSKKKKSSRNNLNSSLRKEIQQEGDL